MRAWFRQLDDLLRGRKTGPEDLAEGRIELALRVFVPAAIVLGAAYGSFMGWYAVLDRVPASYMQLIASMVKLPALFLLTLVVTLPSLYVFNALVGCRLSFSATLRLLVGAIVVNLAVAASFGTILGFFTLSTTSYPFMILLNVALLAAAGFVGLGFLLRTLQRLALWQSQAATENDEADAAPQAGLGQANVVFRIWVIIYGLVGAQMGWLLRPFIGSPNLPFEWLRVRQGNFFQSVFRQVQILLEGG